MAKYKVYISDFDYPDNEVEKSVLEPIGAEVIGLQCKSGEGLAEQFVGAGVVRGAVDETNEDGAGFFELVGTIPATIVRLCGSS